MLTHVHLPGRHAVVALASMFVAILVSAGTAHATVYYVSPIGIPANGGTSFADSIQFDDAVSRAASGDEITMAPGTYARTVAIDLSKDLYIHGQGPANTRIDCSGMMGTGCLQISLTAPVSRAFVLADLEISGITVGYAIEIKEGSPVIRNVRFQNNMQIIRAYYSDGMLTQNTFVTAGATAQVYLSDCRMMVSGNLFSGSGIGVEERATAEGWMTGNSFIGNVFDGLGRAIYTVGSVASDYRRNTFQYNNYGLYFHGTSTPTIVNNLFRDGVAGTQISLMCGGALCPAGTVAYNTIAGNTGLGIWSQGSSLIVNNVLDGIGTVDIGIFSSSSATRVGYNDSYNHGMGNYNGTYDDLGGNISADPLFAAGGYDLQSGSPVIGAANALWYAVLKDILGRTRLPVPPDMGAYEYTP